MPDHIGRTSPVDDARKGREHRSRPFSMPLAYSVTQVPSPVPLPYVPLPAVPFIP